MSCPSTHRWCVQERQINFPRLWLHDVDWCALPCKNVQISIESVPSRAVSYCSMSSWAVVRLRLFQVHRCTSAAGKPIKALSKTGSWSVQIVIEKWCYEYETIHHSMCFHVFWITVMCLWGSHGFIWLSEMLGRYDKIHHYLPAHFVRDRGRLPKDHTAHPGGHGKRVK